MTQIDATDTEAIERGEVRIVLGDCHGGSNSLAQGIFVRRPPDPEAFHTHIADDVGPQVILLAPRAGGADDSPQLSALRQPERRPRRPRPSNWPRRPIEFTDMVPNPDECWLRDDNRSSTSELRIVAVDRTRRRTELSPLRLSLTR